MKRITDKEVIALYNKLKNTRACANYLKTKGFKANKETFRQRLNEARYREDLVAEELEIPDLSDKLDIDGEVEEYVEKLALQKQKLQDINRIERKAWRHNARHTNAFEQVGKQLVKHLQEKEINFKNKTPKVEGDFVGILHLSDLHLNEQVTSVFNTFDWETAAKRLQKHVEQSCRVFSAYGCKSVLLAMTGDITNSDKILDKVLHNATNRADALFLATTLLKSVIEDLSNRGFNVAVSFCIGNEARMNEHIEYSNILASNNFDFMLYHSLRLLLEKTGVQFLTPSNANEAIVDVNGKHLLLMHGHIGITKNLDESIGKVIAKYAKIGTKVDYVIMGHIHQPILSDYFSRSGSLTGSNDYNFYGLNIHGKPSQNCYVFGKNDIIAIKNDLENVDGFEGYNYCKELEAYNTKSASKLHKEETILKIVI